MLKDKITIDHKNVDSNLFNDLDVIIPCFQPHAHWHVKLVNDYNTLCDSLDNIRIRLIVVIDGVSHNITEYSLNYLKIRIKYISIISYNCNKGKGFALRVGCAHSSSKFIILSDVDFPYGTKNIEKMYYLMNDNTIHLVYSKRTNTYYKKIPLLRKYISLFFKSFIKIIFNIGIEDTQAGLLGFHVKYKHMFMATSINKFLYTLEFAIFVSNANSNDYDFILVEPCEYLKMNNANMKTILENFLDLVRLVYRHKIKYKN